MSYGLILAAGFGSRLGHDMPKALIQWQGGTILDMQLARLRAAGVQEVWIVTGFQAERVRAQVEGDEHVHFVDNPEFMDTQNGKSMLVGLEAMPPGGVVTLNADVVFDEGILEQLVADPDASKLAVDPRVCGEEEMKYRVREGRLQAISKQVHGEGEAIGLNYIAQDDRELFVRALRYNDAGQYYERSMDQMIPFTAKPMQCVDIGNLRAMEIDFPEDLEAALKLFA